MRWIYPFQSRSCESVQPGAFNAARVIRVSWLTTYTSQWRPQFWRTWVSNLLSTSAFFSFHPSDWCLSWSCLIFIRFPTLSHPNCRFLQFYWHSTWSSLTIKLSGLGNWSFKLAFRRKISLALKSMLKNLAFRTKAFWLLVIDFADTLYLQQKND